MNYNIKLKENQNVIILRYDKKKGLFDGVTAYNENEEKFRNKDLNTGQARAEFDKYIRNCLMK